MLLLLPAAWLVLLEMQQSRLQRQRHQHLQDQQSLQLGVLLLLVLQPRLSSSQQQALLQQQHQGAPSSSSHQLSCLPSLTLSSGGCSVPCTRPTHNNRGQQRQRRHRHFCLCLTMLPWALSPHLKTLQQQQQHWLVVLVLVGSSRLLVVSQTRRGALLTQTRLSAQCPSPCCSHCLCTAARCVCGGLRAMKWTAICRPARRWSMMMAKARSGRAGSEGWFC